MNELIQYSRLLDKTKWRKHDSSEYNTSFHIGSSFIYTFVAAVNIWMNFQQSVPRPREPHIPVFPHSCVDAWLKNVWILGGSPSLAHLPLDLTEDLLLQFARVVLLQHVVLLPRLCPLLGVLHLLRGQAQVEPDALDVELGSFPAFWPWFWAHPYLDLVNGQRCSIILHLNMLYFHCFLYFYSLEKKICSWHCVLKWFEQGTNTLMVKV